MNKEFYVKALLAYPHTFRLLSDFRATICTWCGGKTEDVAHKFKESFHNKGCPYVAALREEKH